MKSSRVTLSSALFNETLAEMKREVRCVCCYSRERQYKGSEKDLGWLFPKETESSNVYKDFVTLPDDQPVVSII